MRILFLALGNELVASSRTRVFQYLPHLRRSGVTCEVVQFQSGADYKWTSIIDGSNILTKLVYGAGIVAIRCYHFFFGWAALLKLLKNARNHDVIFIQKVVPPAWLVHALAKRRIPFAFDFDDAIYANTFYNVRSIERLVRNAGLSVIENEETERFVTTLGGKALRITGPIDCDRYRPRRREDGAEIVLGWIGSKTTAEYLHLIHEPLRKLCDRYPALRIRLIGAGHIVLPGVAVERFAWNVSSEAELLAGCDIGLMPLPDSEWARGKGGYKLLQYMATGIPSVCSPVGVNAQLIRHSVTGFHALTNDDWFARLEELVVNPVTRREMGAAARRDAESSYSFEAATPILLEELKILAFSGKRENA